MKVILLPRFVYFVNSYVPGINLYVKNTGNTTGCIARKTYSSNVAISITKR